MSYTKSFLNGVKMACKYILLVSIFIFPRLIVNSVADDKIYTWVNEKGEVMYSNTLPHTNKKLDIKVLDDSVTITKNSVFKKKRKKRKKKSEFLELSESMDKKFKEKFSEYGMELPILPDDTKDAVVKLSRIISDETIYIESLNNRLKKYIKEYKKRKKDYEEELNSQRAKMPFWRPRVFVEDIEYFKKRTEKYADEIKKHKLLLQWAEAKKDGLMNEIS